MTNSREIWDWDLTLESPSGERHDQQGHSDVPRGTTKIAVKRGVLADMRKRVPEFRTWQCVTFEAEKRP